MKILNRRDFQIFIISCYYYWIPTEIKKMHIYILLPLAFSLLRNYCHFLEIQGRTNQGNIFVHLSHFFGFFGHIFSKFRLVTRPRN